MSEMNQDSGEQGPQENLDAAVGYSRREVLRLLGAAGAVAGLDRLMPPRWLSPAASALAAPQSPAAPNPIEPLLIENLSFAWGLDPYDQIDRTLVSPSGFYCDGNASFDFKAVAVQVSNATWLSVNSSLAGVIYNESIGSVAGSHIQYTAVDNMAGSVSFPLANSSIAANTMDMLYVAIASPPETSNVLMQEFIPTCGQTTIANLQAVPTTGCLIEDGNNYSCEHVISFDYSPSQDVDGSARVYLQFNGQVLINWEYLSNLGATGGGTGSISFATLLPAGQAGTLVLTVANVYGFETNTLREPFSTIDCAPGQAPFLYNPGVVPYNGPFMINFDFHDAFGQISNDSKVTAWMGGPNMSAGYLLLNGAPIGGPAAMGGAFINNAAPLKWAPANCTAVALSDTYGQGNFQVTLPVYNVSTRAAAVANETINFYLTIPNSTSRSNILNTSFDPSAIALQDLSATTTSAGLVGALGAAALGAASLWSRFRGGEE